MSSRPFRFVHASDFHLESPPTGIAEVPGHLRELFIESAYWAAQKVFETVLAEEAEFLVLAGDILNPEHTGPRGPRFLVDQFTRLAERNIPVYWAGGNVDPPDAWPTSVALPENVHLFARAQVSEFLHERDGTPLARLIGVSRDRQQTIRAVDFEPDLAGRFSIAVVHGNVDAEALQTRAIHYWALGGRHDRSTLLSGPQIAHYPGSPQGRQPQECGVHGCTLVHVDPYGRMQTSLIPTDAMRWIDERVVVDDATTREDLVAKLRERMHSLVEAVPPADLLISWTVAGDGPLLTKLRRGSLTSELLDALRVEYGSGPPAAWTVSMKVELPASLPSQWYEQEAIRGDFLRAVRHLQVNASEPLDLESYVAEEHLAGTLAAAVAPGDLLTRECILREAAWLGVDLLTGEEALS